MIPSCGLEINSFYCTSIYSVLCLHFAQGIYPFRRPDAQIKIFWVMLFMICPEIIVNWYMILFWISDNNLLRVCSYIQVLIGRLIVWITTLMRLVYYLNLSLQTCFFFKLVWIFLLTSCSLEPYRIWLVELLKINFGP